MSRYSLFSSILVVPTRPEAYTRESTCGGQALASSSWSFMWPMLYLTLVISITGFLQGGWVDISLHCWSARSAVTTRCSAGFSCTALGPLMQWTWTHRMGGPICIYSGLSWRGGDAPLSCSLPKDWRELKELLQLEGLWKTWESWGHDVVLWSGMEVFEDRWGAAGGKQKMQGLFIRSELPV